MYTQSLGIKTNRESWITMVEVVDENGADVDISASSFDMAVRLQGDGTPSLNASTDDGSIVIDSLASPMTFTWTFDETDMQGLDPGIYDVGLTITTGGVTSQLMATTVTIIDGIVN